MRSDLLKQKFQLPWNYVSPAAAGQYLDHWRTATLRSSIKPMTKVARTMRGHRELILNGLRVCGAISGGAVKSLHNKLEVTFRKSDGFRTFRAAEVALSHAVGKLPEPAHVHRFF